MSGGHYGHAYFKIQCIKGEIEVDFVNKGKFFCEYEGKKKHHLKDRGANRSQQIKIVNEVDDLLNTLDDVARRVRNLEWFMSGDDGVKDYIDKIQNKKF